MAKKDEPMQIGRHYNEPLFVKLSLTASYVLLGPPLLFCIFIFAMAIIGFVYAIALLMLPFAPAWLAYNEIWKEPPPEPKAVA